MKRLFLCSMVIPSLFLSAEELQGEKEHPHTPLLDNTYVWVQDFVEVSQKLFDLQSDKLSQLIERNRTEILDKLTDLHHELAAFQSPKDSSAKKAVEPTSVWAEGAMIASESPVDASENIQVQQTATTPSSIALSPGYNAPYDLNLTHPYHVFGSVSFLYWRATQQGMQTYTMYSSDSSSDGVNATLRKENYQMGSIDFKYKPGFKIGLGGDLPYDHWQMYTEYTWYHHHFFDTFHFKGSPSTIGGPLHSYSNLFPDFNLKLNNTNNFLAEPSTLHSKFDLNLNWVFLELARSYYVGEHFVFRTHFGLRGDHNTQAIVQEMDLSQTTTVGGTTAAPVQGRAKQTTQTWGIGPRAGVTGNYLMPYGFKIFGNFAASLLYTHATLKGKQNTVLGLVSDRQTQEISLEKLELNTVSPNVEAGIGLGWGSHVNRRRWHIDLDLSYDVNILWNQNMFRQLTVETINSDAGDGDVARVLYRDLFLDGLTAKLSLAF